MAGLMEYDINGNNEVFEDNHHNTDASNVGSFRGTSDHPFVPIEGEGTMLLSDGRQITVVTRLQCFSAMSFFNQKSLEELRWEDYVSMGCCETNRYHFTICPGPTYSVAEGPFGITLQLPFCPSPATIHTCRRSNVPTFGNSRKYPGDEITPLRISFKNDTCFIEMSADGMIVLKNDKSVEVGKHSNQIKSLPEQSRSTRPCQSQCWSQLVPYAPGLRLEAVQTFSSVSRLSTSTHSGHQKTFQSPVTNTVDGSKPAKTKTLHETSTHSATTNPDMDCKGDGSLPTKHHNVAEDTTEDTPAKHRFKQGDSPSVNRKSKHNDSGISSNPLIDTTFHGDGLDICSTSEVTSDTYLSLTGNVRLSKMIASPTTVLAQDNEQLRTANKDQKLNQISSLNERAKLLASAVIESGMKDAVNMVNHRKRFSEQCRPSSKKRKTCTSGVGPSFDVLHIASNSVTPIKSEEKEKNIDTNKAIEQISKEKTQSDTKSHSHEFTVSIKDILKKLGNPEVINRVEPFGSGSLPINKHSTSDIKEIKGICKLEVPANTRPKKSTDAASTPVGSRRNVLQRH